MLSPVLTPSLAQEIARDTSEVIGFNVLITDHTGTVIGSGDTSRLGSFHEASLEVLQTKEPAWHSAAEAHRLRGVRPGMTLPILTDGRAVGTVGITGSPRQVRRFGLVVRRQTEILLQESLALRSNLLRERSLEELARDLAAFDPELVDPGFLIARARELGYDLTRPRTVLILELEDAPSQVPTVLRALRDAFTPADLVTTQTSGRFVVLPTVRPAPDSSGAEVRLGLARAAVRAVGLPCRAAAGGIGSDVAGLCGGFADATDALRLGTRVEPGGTAYVIDDWRGHQLLASVGHRARSTLVAGAAGQLMDQPDWPDLRGTLIAWCESGFNLVRTAAALHIHRNTLIYRLDKIARLTGRPWRDHRASLAIYLACLADQLDRTADRAL